MALNSSSNTVKYDFRIAPESVAGIKHHFGLGLGLRNGKGLWNGSLLRAYFRINGIKHPDDMSAILLTTFHRKLNGKPINFREQKKDYKEYWKVARIGIDTLNQYLESKNILINQDSVNKVYFSNFEKGRHVLGTVKAWKQRENNASEIDIKMIAEIIERKERKMKLKIIEIGKSKEGFEL